MIEMRWMVKKDLPQIVKIEQACFECPMNYTQLYDILKVRNCIGIVVEQDKEQILGYMIYELLKDRFRMVNIAVDPFYQKEGHARKMIQYLIEKCNKKRRNNIEAYIPDSNLNAHLFMRAVGFRATSVERNYFDNGQDAYHFEYFLNLTKEILEEMCNGA